MSQLAQLESTLLNSPWLALLHEHLGRHLDDEREKRHRFYEEMNEQQKIEFINGEVLMHSPARLRHVVVSDNILCLLRLHVIAHDLGFVGHEKMLVCLTRNDYEPDVCFFGKAKAAGFAPGQMRFPAPDLAVEILSESTEDKDRGVKFHDYAAHGVGEYWIVDADAGVVEQYVLRDGDYARLDPPEPGWLASEVVAGFRVPVAAFFDAEAHRRALGARG